MNQELVNQLYELFKLNNMPNVANNLKEEFG